MGRSKDIATSAKGDADYVNVAGDTMTGSLTLNNDIIANKHLRLYTTDDQANQWYVYNNTDDTLRFNYNGAGNDEVVLDTVGRMKIPNQPHFYANRAGLSNEYRNGNVNYNVVRDTASGWNSSNHQYTIPVTGVYHFGFNNIGHSGVDGSDQYHALQFVRGGTTTFIASAYNTNDAQHENTNIAITYYLQANDLVQMRNYGGVVYSGFYNTFSIYLLG